MILNAQQFNLMPYPAEITSFSNESFRLDKNFTIEIKGSPDDRIYSSASRALRRLSGRTGLFFSQNYLSKNNNPANASLTIFISKNAEIKLGEDESYLLTISSKKIELNAETDLGAMHGLETLLQLLSADKNGYYFPSVKINDKPRFPWRGLLIDACRHWMPMEVIKRNLDGLAAVKMNVMHWHLSEDQGFRVESKVYPKLHQLGSDGFYYTQEQIKEIIDYAAERGIRVIPEFDIPGHATSWFVGYPELASAPGPYTIERNWGIFDPTFDPTKEETYEFFDNFFGEMSKLFPDEYFHIGGDENNGKQWDANPEIQKFMKENNLSDNHALQTYFNQRIFRILKKHGKKMMGWDEILQPELPKNIVIQSWRGTKALVEAAKKGYMGILSNGYYIDLIQPTDFHYLNDPIPADAELSEAEQERILGGEATMWSELVTAENVDTRIWPRTAAIAERFWSPREINNVDNMYNRLEWISFYLEDYGLTHIKNREMMIRRLTGFNDADPLKILLGAIEPVKIYTRHRQGVKYTSYSPYTRIVDAAVPDAKPAREFRKLVDDYLNGNNNLLTELKTDLQLWAENHKKMNHLMEASPILREIDTLSQNLAEISLIGLEAINKIERQTPADLEWKNTSQAKLEKAKLPYGQTEIMILPAIEKLIIKAAEKK